MIVDENRIELMPGNNGDDCLGNGTHVNKNGNIVCLCDGCDFLMCCVPEYGGDECEQCNVPNCPRRIKLNLAE